jgi:hypothetical protein
MANSRKSASNHEYAVVDTRATVIGGCIAIGAITAVRGVFKNHKDKKYRILINGV